MIINPNRLQYRLFFFIIIILDNKMDQFQWLKKMDKTFKNHFHFINWYSSDSHSFIRKFEWKKNEFERGVWLKNRFSFVDSYFKLKQTKPFYNVRHLIGHLAYAIMQRFELFHHL